MFVSWHIPLLRHIHSCYICSPSLTNLKTKSNSSWLVLVPETQCLSTTMTNSLRTFGSLHLNSNKGSTGSVISRLKTEASCDTQPLSPSAFFTLNLIKRVHTFLSVSPAALVGFRWGSSEVVRSRSDWSSHVCPRRHVGPPASEHQVEHHHCTALAHIHVSLLKHTN